MSDKAVVTCALTGVLKGGMGTVKDGFGRIIPGGGGDPP